MGSSRSWRGATATLHALAEFFFENSLIYTIFPYPTQIIPVRACAHPSIRLHAIPQSAPRHRNRACVWYGTYAQRAVARRAEIFGNSLGLPGALSFPDGDRRP
eukprot:scaffold23126_cov241-Isochrysis_galbana.AAC.13